MRQHAEGNNIAQAAVCDVSTHRANAAKKFVSDNSEDKVEAYTDYRKVLERKDIDAVVCATVDHWHKRICIDAMDSGKDVYVEKHHLPAFPDRVGTAGKVDGSTRTTL